MDVFVAESRIQRNPQEEQNHWLKENVCRGKSVGVRLAGRNRACQATNEEDFFPKAYSMPFKLRGFEIELVGRDTHALQKSLGEDPMTTDVCSLSLQLSHAERTTLAIRQHLSF